MPDTYQNQEKPTAEETHNSSSTSNTQPGVASPVTSSSPAQKKKHNWGIWVIATLLMLILMVMTCPSVDDHGQAILEVATENILGEEDSQDEFGSTVDLFATMFVDEILDHLLTVHGYGIFSIGRIHDLSGEAVPVSFGIFGHVFIFDTEDLKIDL